jgi:hypothetical protein
MELQCVFMCGRDGISNYYSARLIRREANLPTLTSKSQSNALKTLLNFFPLYISWNSPLPIPRHFTFSQAYFYQNDDNVVPLLKKIAFLVTLPSALSSCLADFLFLIMLQMVNMTMNLSLLTVPLVCATLLPAGICWYFRHCSNTRVKLWQCFFSWPYKCIGGVVVQLGELQIWTVHGRECSASRSVTYTAGKERLVPTWRVKIFSLAWNLTLVCHIRSSSHPHYWPSYLCQ